MRRECCLGNACLCDVMSRVVEGCHAKNGTVRNILLIPKFGIIHQADSTVDDTEGVNMVQIAGHVGWKF